MSKIQVFDPAMCCSTGVCGPEVDPALVRFAADLEWLKESGVAVERFNLSQEPAAFVSNQEVVTAMRGRDDALPLLLLDGKIVAQGAYPERAAVYRRETGRVTLRGFTCTAGGRLKSDCRVPAFPQTPSGRCSASSPARSLRFARR